jgi:hypothetical protein
VGGSQRGLSLFGALIIVVIAVVAGYYAYQSVMGEDEAPSCNGALNACLKYCRRTTTEAPAAQSCQQACMRDADECNRQRR